MKRRWAGCCVAVVTILALVLSGCPSNEPPDAGASIEPPTTVETTASKEPGEAAEAATMEMAPDVTLTDLSGESVTLGSLRGGIVVVYFWATYCVPCVEKLPRMEAIHEAYRGKGVQIWALSLDGDADVVAGWLEQQDMTIPVGLMDDEMREKFFPGKKLVPIPQTLLIDAEGRIAQWLGAEMTLEELEESIKALLGEAG